MVIFEYEKELGEGRRYKKENIKGCGNLSGRKTC
jgi:hypothetical protein